MADQPVILLLGHFPDEDALSQAIARREATAVYPGEPHRREPTAMIVGQGAEPPTLTATSPPRFSWRRDLLGPEVPALPDDPELAAWIAVETARRFALELDQHRVQQERSTNRDLVRLADTTQSIAHKSNNQLGILSGYMAIVRDDPSIPGDIRERLLTMDHALQALSRLNRGLTRIIKKIQPRPHSVHLGKIILESIDHLVEELDIRAAIEVRLPEDPPYARASSHHLHTALQALFLNAWESYSERIQDRPILVEVKSVEDPPGIEITVSDQGRGMPSEFLDVAWDPFVTTKSDPEGGLGLTIARHLVRQIEGTLELVSSPGRGTSATITLPAASAPGEEKPRKLLLDPTRAG